MSGPGIAWSTVEDALQSWIATATGIASTSVIWGLQNDQRPPTPFVTLRVMNVLRTGLDWRNYADAPLVLTPITITGEAGGVFLAPAHGLKQGDGPVQVMSTLTLPGGLAAVTNYWAIPVDVDHLQLASTFLDAWVPTPVVVTDAGTGTVTVVSTANTRRAGAELNALSRGMRRVTLSVQCFGGDADGAASPTALLDAVVSALPGRAKLLRAAGVGVMQTSAVGSTDGIVNATVLEPRATLTLTLSLKSEVQDPDTYIERVVATPTVDGVDGTPVTWTLP